MLVPALRCGLDAYLDPPQGVQMDSAFALQCARQVHTLRIRDKVFRLPGLATFVAAAKQVTTVTIVCNSVSEAAQADLLLKQCSAVTALSLSGNYMPALLPASVTELSAGFSNPAECECSTSQPDALLYHAALLPQLRTLDLHLCTTGQPAAVSLQLPVQLSFLQSLDIYTIRVSAPMIDLNWVQQQACSRVSLLIVADTPDMTKHAAILEQLSRMPPSSLSLEVHMDVPFTLELQALWSRLEVTYLRLGMFAVTSVPLQTLPCCSELCYEYSPPGGGPVYVTWQALTRQPAKISMDVVGELHVLGAGSSPPEHLTQPWQLEVDRAVAVYGPPASQPTTGCKYFLQNAAARAAG